MENGKIETCYECGEDPCGCDNISLATVQEIEPAVLFATGGLDVLKAELDTRFQERPTDASTEEGRKEIISFAMKFSKDGSLVTGIGDKYIKERSKAIEEETLLIMGLKKANKAFKAYCVEKRKEARAPVTEWEEAEKEKERLEELRITLERDEVDAYNENELYDLRKEKEAREAEEARKAHEAQIAKEAEERAQREAEAAIQAAKAAEAKAKANAEAAARQAEIDKQAAIAAAKAEAEAKAKAEQEAQEREAARVKAEAEARAANVAHQKEINNDILGCMYTTIMCLKTKRPEATEHDIATEIIIAIARGKIRHVTINY